MGKRRIEVLKVLREKAEEAIRTQGMSQKEACTMFGFSPTRMTKYIKAYKQSGEKSFVYKKRGVGSGDRNLLSLEQERALIESITSHTQTRLAWKARCGPARLSNTTYRKFIMYNIQNEELGIL